MAIRIGPGVSLGQRALSMTQQAAPSAPVTLIWHENHETNDPTPLYGRLSQWYASFGGNTSPSPDDDSADSGGSTSRPTDGALTTQKHSGSWGMRTNISVTASAKAGCRTNYRPLLASNQLGEYYYGAWYYIPTRVAVGTFWQHMQFKVRHVDTSNAPAVAYGIYIINPGVGQMSYRLSYKLGGDSGIAGPFSGYPAADYSEDSAVLVPEATWYHLETFLKPSVYPDYSGRITVRLNGTQIFDWNNIVTLDQSTDRFNVWHITNYGHNLGNGNSVGSGSATIVLWNDDETIGQNGWIYGSAVQPW